MEEEEEEAGRRGSGASLVVSNRRKSPSGVMPISVPRRLSGAALICDRNRTTSDRPKKRGSGGRKGLVRVATRADSSGHRSATATGVRRRRAQ